jgi:hypothetical protein
MNLDLSTVGGQNMYAALIKLAPAFDEVATAAEEATKSARDLAQQRVNDAKDALDEKQDKLVDAYRTQSDAIQAVVDKFRKFSDQLRSFKNQLQTGTLAGLSPQDQYFATKSAFEATRARAAQGDSGAIAQLQSVSEAFLDASRNYFASGTGYFQDLEAVKGVVDTVLKFTDNQVSTGDALQKSLDQMVNTFAENNGLLLRVQDGIVSLDGTFKLSSEQIANAVFTQDGRLVDIRTATIDGAGQVVTSVNTSAIVIGGAVQGAMGAVQAAITDMGSALASYQSAVAAQNALIAQQQQDAAAAAAAAQAATLAAIQAAQNANNSGTATSVTQPVNTGPTYSDHYSEIRAERPDVVSEAERLLATADRNSPWFNQHGLNGGVNGFIDWWLQNKPANDVYSPDSHAVGNYTGMVGGSGGTDSRKISFRATPGELVSVHTPNQVKAAVDQGKRTEALLEQMISLLDGANQQRADAHSEMAGLMGKQISESSATKRASRLRKLA